MEIKKVGNSSLFNLLEQGGLMSNEIYYHRHCYNNMVQNCEKLETDESIMDVKWKKAAIFKSMVNHILDAETENLGSSGGSIQCMLNSYKYMEYKKRSTQYVLQKDE